MRRTDIDAVLHPAEADASAAAAQVEVALQGLGDAIKTSDPVRICESSRGVASLCILAYKYPQAWPHARLLRALDLMKQGIDATHEVEPFYSKCNGRRETFERCVLGLKDARQELERLWAKKDPSSK